DGPKHEATVSENSKKFVTAAVAAAAEGKTGARSGKTGLVVTAGVRRDPRNPGGGSRNLKKGHNMSQASIVRAWKDEDYRLSLSEAERASLPANPAGIAGLTEAEMADVDGGKVSVVILWSLICWGD